MRGRMASPLTTEAAMDAQLQQIIELQTEQNQLLKRYLWRIRFSLLTLLILTTLISLGFGFVIYSEQRKSVGTFPTFPTVNQQVRSYAQFLMGLTPRSAVPG